MSIVRFIPNVNRLAKAMSGPGGKHVSQAIEDAEAACRSWPRPPSRPSAHTSALSAWARRPGAFANCWICSRWICLPADRPSTPMCGACRSFAAAHSCRRRSAGPCWRVSAVSWRMSGRNPLADRHQPPSPQRLQPELRHSPVQNPVEPGGLFRDRGTRRAGFL